MLLISDIDLDACSTPYSSDSIDAKYLKDDAVTGFQALGHSNRYMQDRAIAH